VTLMLIYNTSLLISYIYIYSSIKGLLCWCPGRVGGGAIGTTCHKVHESVSQVGNWWGGGVAQQLEPHVIRFMSQLVRLGTGGVGELPSNRKK
jgi:hypothetical protein